MADENRRGPGGDRVARLAAIASMLGAGALFLVWGIELRTTTDELTLSIVRNHFAAVVGLPLAGVAAFIVVVLLRQTNGPIEFEGADFKFRGASGPVVLWIFCFLAIAVAIKILW